METPYRNITSAVRTPRYAVFIDIADKFWKTYVESIIQSFSQVWGGEYFLIIPTDGKTIDEKFWEILEAYSPDKLGKYVPNFRDLEEANPKQYQAVKEQYRKSWKLDDKEFEKTWNEQVKSSHINGLEVSKELSEELKNRLSPFYFQDHIISENVFRDSPLGFPFTHIENIVESAIDRPTQITIPREMKDVSLRLLASSRVGAASATYRETLGKLGFTEITIPAKFRTRDYILALDGGDYDFGMQRALSEGLGHSTADYPQEDFHRHFPFRLSMLYLGQFYRRDTHREESEKLLVIIGDDISDYCLYYCLSRLHEGVYWLPETYLQKANAKHQANKKRKDDEIKKYTLTEDLAVGLIMEYYKKIGYGHNQKRIDITSATLTPSQLNNRKQWMCNVCWVKPAELTSFISVLPLEEVSVSCVMRVIEANNHANQQDMIFQNGKSVGRVNTPKPKNFSPVNPAEHRWITTLEVDGYCPPVLPFLGAEIIQLRNMSHETRVAKDGLAYLCPNIGYFGGDIDVNTVRPELQLLSEEEIFSKYFAYSGYSMQLSDKGSYLKDTIARFGSLEEVAEFFRAGHNRLLFDQFLIAKQQQDEEVIYLDIEKRAYLSFKAMERKLANGGEAIELVDNLISKDILRRGLIFQCSRCRLSAWYGIEEVGREFKCNRCDLVQPYSYKNWKSPSEPRWYYRLAETVYLFYKHGSYLTALSLDKLRQESKIAFHYICETDILNPLGKIKKRELDILAISDGNIVIGEAKDTKPKASDVTKYNSLFAELTIKPSQFILATTEDTVSSDVNNALQKFKSFRLLSKSDLF